MYYDKEKDAAEAKKFADYWSISGERLVQIDLLKRLGVVSGDNYNNFNPKKNINRAEMAVMPSHSLLGHIFPDWLYPLSVSAQ